MADHEQDNAGTRAQRTAAGLLAWYRDMGADHALEETAVDWLARADVRPGADFKLPEAAPPLPVALPRAPVSRPSPTAAPPPRPRPAMQLVPSEPQPTARSFPTAAPDEATLAARETARAAQSIEDLQVRLAAFNGCGLKATAKSLCFYRGSATAHVMVIGDAPGRDEDKLGKPFVGPAGQMLDKMLAAIGLSEADTHITNIVYWRPPGNRPPTPQEALVCRPFLDRQVELVQPQVVVLLGGHAASSIFDDADGIMKLRGKWRDVVFGSYTVRVLATLHPTNLLNTPPSKRMAWRDLLAIDAVLRAT